MLINNKADFKNDLTYFENLYNCTVEEFIKNHSDSIEIDLKDKIVVSLESVAWRDESIPCNILGVLIPEEDKYKYTVKLIYSGHIAFIKISYYKGSVAWLYKDDECHPQTFDEAIDEERDLLYLCRENGFTEEDILEQIEMTVRLNYDFRFKINKENLIILEGL